MIRRRAGRVLLALGITAGMAVAMAGVAGAQPAVTTKQSDGGFKGLKATKEPTTCPSQDGLTSNEIKVGALIPNSGPSAASFGPSRDGLQARIEKANAENIAKLQAEVIICDIKPHTLAETQAMIAQIGGKSSAYLLDVSDKNAFFSLAEKVIAPP